MKIFKIDNSNNKINFRSKTVLTKPNLTTKIDMFCKSNEVKRALNNKFIQLRESLSEKLYPALLNAKKSSWNFYINSTNENLEIMTKYQDEYSDIFRDEDFYNKLLKIKSETLDKHEARQLEDLIKDFEEELNSGEELKLLREKSSQISKKYNSYIPKIDGKETTKVEIIKILQKESNPEIREKAYRANVLGGDLIAEDLQEFVRMRNDFAKTKGYKTFFEYNLKESYNVDINELQELLDNVYLQSKDLIDKVLSKKQNELSEFFGINKEDLKSYHYGYLTDNNPEKKVNECLKTKEQIVEISKKAYKGMGYDLDKLLEEGKLTLDLFPRKNKNTHGFCFRIDSGLDARILANLTNNATSIDTLNHELGHCVYTLGVSRELPYFDRDEYPAMTEAIAMMMGDLQKRENILKNIVDKNILEEFKNTFVEDEVYFITKALTLINFEKQMYENPEQDLKKLWHDLKVKYQKSSEKEELDNSWATIPHFLSHPAYYQNYFRATIIKAQIYNYLTSKLGNITENQKTAAVLNEELFKFGVSMEENELVEKFTGKKLSVDDFVKSLK